MVTFIRHSVFYLQKLKILWNVSDKFVWRKLFQLLYDPAYYQQQKLDKHQNKSIKENISRKLLKKLSEIFLMFTGFLFKLSSFQAQTSVGMSLPDTKLIYPHTKQTPVQYLMSHFCLDWEYTFFLTLPFRPRCNSKPTGYLLLFLKTNW